MYSGVLICTPHRQVMGPVGPMLDTVTIHWMRARMKLQAPFGMDWTEFRVDGMLVADARNAACQYALDNNFEFVFFLDDDVIVPTGALQQLANKILNYPEVDVMSGVYCSKCDYATPLIYKDDVSHAHWQWTIGEMLIDGIKGFGMGCTLIRTSLLQRMAHSKDNPWFKTTEKVEVIDDKVINTNETEDFYFLTRARKECNSKLAVDTSILCNHIDKKTGLIYKLPEDSLPFRRWRLQQDAKTMKDVAINT